MGVEIREIGNVQGLGIPLGGGADPIVQVDRSAGKTICTLSDAGTNTVPVAFQIIHKSTGIPAANFGAGIDIQLHDATNVQVDACAINCYFSAATHGSVTTAFDFIVINAGTAATLLTLDGAAGLKVGTAAGQKIGFYGTAPIAQAVLATGASHTADDIITKLQALGLVKQS